MSTEKTDSSDVEASQSLRPTETQNSPSLSRTESNNESNAFDYNSFTISLKEVDVARLYRPDMSCEEFIRKITNETTWIKWLESKAFVMNYRFTLALSLLLCLFTIYVFYQLCLFPLWTHVFLSLFTIAKLTVQISIIVSFILYQFKILPIISSFYINIMLVELFLWIISLFSWFFISYGNIAISRLTLMLTYMIPVLLMLELLNNMYLKRFSKNHPSTFQEYNEASSFYISLNKIVQIYNKERYKTFFHDLFVFSN